MIEVLYEYVNSWGVVKKGASQFSDVKKALRFIYSMKNKRHMFLEGWKCEWPEDNEYLSRRISLAYINGGKL